MNIHEYQAKELLKAFGLPVLPGLVAETPEDAKIAAGKLQGPVWVVKAQIHAGGRGKGGGVKLVRSPEDVAAAAEKMLHHPLITPQTGPEGRIVRRVYIEEGCHLKKEYYLSCLLDRETSRVTLLASTEGGMDIEEVAHSSPEKIHKVAIDPVAGFQPYHGRKLAFGLGLEGVSLKSFMGIAEKIYKAFVELDASLIEINPLAQVEDGTFVLLDGKISFDENALYRHKNVQALRDEHEEEPAEREAAQQDISYIKLDGNIGCMVNGAGLAMATMDIIKLYGGNPANFLDVGGGAPKERVIAAFRIILSDPNIEGILVNIFGGIMRCDIIAEGLVAAAKELGVKVPLVVRLEGTNVDLGKKILKDSGLAIIPAQNLADAAEKIVNAVKEAA